jgi:hypothetical protein
MFDLRMAIVVGRDEVLDVPSALERVPETRLESVTLLLTTVDSDRDVADLPSVTGALRDAGATFSRVGSAVALPWPSFRALLAAKLLSGFDEVWLCRGDPLSTPPPDGRITADHEITQPSANPIGWMKESACLAGLGDGAGLNWIAPTTSSPPSGATRA